MRQTGWASGRGLSITPGCWAEGLQAPHLVVLIRGCCLHFWRRIKQGFGGTAGPRVSREAAAMDLLHTVLSLSRGLLCALQSTPRASLARPSSVSSLAAFWFC